MRRPDGLRLRHSLREALGSSSKRVEVIAKRQERTIDAVLQRLYDADETQRREMVLLADEVGLGKTFVALGVAWSVLEQRRSAKFSQGPVLIVVPQSQALFKKWQREAERFVKLVAPEGRGFEVTAVEKPWDVARELRIRKPRIVLARMPAFSGRLGHRRESDLAVLHTLFHDGTLDLTMAQRRTLVSDKPDLAKGGALSLRKSGRVWNRAENAWDLGFTRAQLASAFERIRELDPWLFERLHAGGAKARLGSPPPGRFWDDIRELGRAALGQSIPHRLPLVIVDEVHNWKNHPGSWWRFHHMLGHRVDRLLGLSATPFQLGPQELIRVLQLRKCLLMKKDRKAFLNDRAAVLERQLRTAESAGKALRRAWTDVTEADMKELRDAWPAARDQRTSPKGLPPRLRFALSQAADVHSAHQGLATSMRPFLLRHRHDTKHRVWWVGCDARIGNGRPTARGSALKWRPGLDVMGDAELVHYLMMRAVHEEKQQQGLTSLGADLGGSYAFFRSGELRRNLPGSTPLSRRYLALVDQATDGVSHEHPKIAVTAERAFKRWVVGEKTLIFCFNVATTGAVMDAVRSRVTNWQQETLCKAFQCDLHELEQKQRNFRSRLYNRRQAMFLLFQDHPLTGPTGKVPRRLAFGPKALEELIRRLAAIGAPRKKGLFSRRLLLATAEQELVRRWSKTAEGSTWLRQRGAAWNAEGRELAATIGPAAWTSRRRDIVEGVEREFDPEPEDDALGGEEYKQNLAAWRRVVHSRAGQDVLAPYLRDGTPGPSLLSQFHATTMAALPWRLRRLAAGMLRQMLRSPGFLARFLLSEVHDPTMLTMETMTRRYNSASYGRESARERFATYLDDLMKARDLPVVQKGYEDARRNRLAVARITGQVANDERDRQFIGFNSPLVPEVLIVNSVGQEGIDLHRECRHVIHHDLPWNPATLEQRTGRVDRIGSKTERLVAKGSPLAQLDVVVPYVAGTYDEHRFRVVHGRAHIFEVTMGGDFAVDGYRRQDDAMDATTQDDEGADGSAWALLPTQMAADLGLRLEAEGDPKLM